MMKPGVIFHKEIKWISKEYLKLNILQQKINIVFGSQI